MSEPADGSDQAIEIWKIKKVRKGEKSGEEGGRQFLLDSFDRRV